LPGQKDRFKKPTLVPLKITVVKKSGAKEPWNDSKLKDSIAAAANDADLNKDRTKQVMDNVMQKVIDQLCGEKEVTSYMVREIILRELENIEPRVAEAWRKYELTKKKAP